MDRTEKDILLQKYADANRRLTLAQEQLAIANQKLKEYEEKAQKAEKASKMKSLFLANMSHEIRTPLNAIEGFSRVLVETDSQEDRMKFFEIIESNNNRLMSLVNEILDLSRVESGEIVMKKSSTDLNQLCESIRNIFKFRCPETLKLEWKKPNMAVTFVTDANRITQVFSNLISNALKHTHTGSITYGYRMLDEGSHIEFYVQDTGSGIAPEDIPHLFETYVSRDAETKNNGYGLGLALCKIIVEKLGGNIYVDSKMGEGSLFRFVLPFEGTIGGMSPVRNTTTSNVRTIRVSGRPDNMNKKSILVAEDEDSNYELVKIVLHKRYRLIRAHNGIEAVTLNEEEHPDLILMDIRMPEMNGLDATRIIKEVDSNTPVIALSAYAFEENIREAKNAGCDEFMAKPFKVENLIEMVGKYLD
ncbi:ATP-binding protein [Prevotella sp. P6B1]|uniref:ATP-binding response regulator n=1 Tax=Prevotella sp. P6B1 TaxID=1410613 RepID=UPI0006910730|nr:ATP-binding protein [Prevotella sp. P6B1]